MGHPLTWRVGTYTNTYATVGAATTEIVATNPNRMHLVLVNDSTQVMYLAFGADAVIGSGVRLNASGGSYEMTPENLFTAEIDAICAGGQANITILEGVK